MIITLFGSCRQHSIRNHYIVTDIQENLTYPHYTKEVIQAITYCKGTHAFDNSLTQHCFRAGILHKRPILYQKELQRQFENTDVFVVEIASRIAYEWNGLYVHHILTEEQYGFHDISNIRQRDLTDDEIEADLLTIKRELYPKKLLVVPHVYTRTHGKRYELVQLLERLCYKHDIPFMNPSARTQHIQGIYENEQAFHYTPTGHALIGQHYKEVIETICQKKTVILVWKQEYADVPRTNDMNFWGIGDMLCGAIGAFHLSKKYNFDFIVDKAHHPICQLLKQDKHRFSDLLAANIDKVPTFMKAPDEVEYHIQHFMANPHSRVMWFYSNMTHEHAYGTETSAELQDFIRYTLRPRDEFAAYINAHIPKHPYSILHYRLGDTELVRSDTSATPCDRVFIHFLQRYSESDIVLSDSETFKQYIRTYYPAARMFDTQVCHIGHEESYTALRDTLFELFAIMRATHIRSYTVYGWPSGFINAIHKVFSIPATFQKHFDVAT